MDKDLITRMSDSDLLSIFVMRVGYDYRESLQSPHIHPDFSDETVELWNEVEKRMKGTVALDFDRDLCKKLLREEITKQADILKGGADYATSYHYGLQSGLNLAFRIVEGCITEASE